ncbi:Translocase of chloroplast, chloroplastic [Sesamum alatum]|uniref:Translocase of chloroplast, chloroplastic n=1 Tax=Sesamum alatum TaxID=300844 RepID=A0AAE2CKT9_9LAMI|nr:Translocase of chloroplast, chloroplastic [Sesamum alatum]
MDSRLNGVPLSATQMAPKAASSNTISGIRAPLTVDDSDSEYSLSPRSHSNSTAGSYYSGSELESEGSVSGEDETETASERPRMTDQDEEILEEILQEQAFSKPNVEIVQERTNSNEHGVSRPSMENPDEAFPRVSGNVSRETLFRPFVRNPDERVNSIVDDSDDARPFLGESGDELVEDEDYGRNTGKTRPFVALMDEDVSDIEPMPVVDPKIPRVRKVQIPIAQISGDSDDDSETSVVLEDNSSSGVVGVPSIEVLQRVNSAPKVRILEVDEGDDNESQAENMVEMEFVEDLAINNDVLDTKDEMEHSGMDDAIHRDISTDTIQDETPDANKEARADSLVTDEEFIEDLVISNDVLDHKDEMENTGVEDSIDWDISADAIQDEAPDASKEARAVSLVTDGEFIEDLVISNDVLDRKDEKENTGVEDIIHWDISADAIQDEAPDASKQARAVSLVTEEEFIEDVVVSNDVLDRKDEKENNGVVDIIHWDISADTMQDEAPDADTEARAVSLVTDDEFIEDLVISNDVLDHKDEKENTGVEDSIHWDISADAIQDEAPYASKEARAVSLVTDEEFIEDLVISNDVLDHKDEKENTGVEDSIHWDISADAIQDEAPLTSKEARVDSLVTDEEFIEDFVISNDVLDCKNEMENTGVEDSIHYDISADTIQYEAPNASKEARADTLVTDEEYNSIFESEQNEDLMHLDEVIQEIDVIDDRRKSGDLVDLRDPTYLAEDTLVPGNICSVALAAEQRCVFGTDNLMETEHTELGSSNNFGAAFMDDGDPKSSNTSFEDNLVFNQDIDSQNMETESEKEIGQTVESFSSTAGHKTVSHCVDITELPTEVCCQFSELPESLTDSLLTDASLIGVDASQSVFQSTKLDHVAEIEAKNSEEFPREVEGSAFHPDTKAVATELEREQDSASLPDGEALLDHSQGIGGQNVTDSEEGADADGGVSDHRRITLAGFLKAVKGAVSDDSTFKLTSVDGIQNLPLEGNSADLGSIFLSARPIIGARSSDSFTPLFTNDEFDGALSEVEKQQLEKIQKIRVKYLHFLHRLGCSPGDSAASKVLYQLAIAEPSSSSQAFHLDSALKVVMDLEAQTKDDLEFSLCILVIGKTGVGKSATINSIFGERKTVINAFEPATTRVKEITGMMDGVKIKVFDTPGLRTSTKDQSINRKVLSSIKKVMRRSPPDVILYIDRLDTECSYLNDLPLLKSVTSHLGTSIWRKSIVALTHATSTPPDGPYGYPLSYEVFVAQRSQVAQQLISHSAMNPGSVIPVNLVENHPFAKKNEHGETLLQSGESWRRQLLLSCYSVKILSELSSVVTIPNPFNHMKLFGLRIRSPSPFYFLSSLLQSNVHPKLSNDQSGVNVDSGVELGYLSDSDHEEDFEYDNLPPFKPLDKSQIAELSSVLRKAYFEEYDYRVRLLQKKQLREEIRRFRDSRKEKNGAANGTYLDAVMDQQTGSAETIAIPLPDMALPPSFDGDDPSFRYRFLEPSSQLLTRPVFDSQGWDHDCGYDGVIIEDKVDIGSHFPAAISVQLTKDKKECNIQLQSSVSAKHGDKGSTMAGLDIQTFGNKQAVLLKGETKVRNSKKNTTAAGVSITFLEENVVSGLKVEDHIAVRKSLMLSGNAGVVRSQDGTAYGANLELCRRDKDYPIDQDQVLLGLSIMRYRGDLICGCNLQSQFSVGRNSKWNIRAGLNNKLSGQISIKTSCSDQLQIAALALLPVVRTIFKKIFPESTDGYSG